MAWWMEGEVTMERQCNAERAPIQAAVEQPKTARVDICERATGFQCREVEWKALDLREPSADARGGKSRSLVDGTKSRFLGHVNG
jgi:hypothetical protein